MSEPWILDFKGGFELEYMGDRRPLKEWDNDEIVNGGAWGVVKARGHTTCPLVVTPAAQKAMESLPLPPDMEIEELDLPCPRCEAKRVAGAAIGGITTAEKLAKGGQVFGPLCGPCIIELDSRGYKSVQAKYESLDSTKAVT